MTNHQNINLKKNTLWSIGEVIFSSLSLFLLYKIVFHAIGVNALGVWSLVLATTSIARLADLGTASGLARFVSASLGCGDKEKARLYLETGITTNILLYSFIALLVWAPAYYLLPLALTGEDLLSGRVLLPYSLLSLVISSLSSAAMSGIMGQQRFKQKFFVISTGLTLQFILAYTLVPRLGLVGLALGQLTQNFYTLFVCWALFLKNETGQWSLRHPFHWDKGIFKEAISFGVKLQSLTIIGMLNEPIIKFLISSIGGVATLGYFEMAQRAVMQVRLLSMAPNQVLIPSFARITDNKSPEIAKLYHTAQAYNLVYGVPLVASIALLSPVISFLWVNKIDPTLVFYMIVLALGWAANLASVPAYSLSIGRGLIRWNFYAALFTMAGTAILGFLLGQIGGGDGVVISVSILLAIGSLAGMFLNCGSFGISPLPSKEHLVSALNNFFRKPPP